MVFLNAPLLFVHSSEILPTLLIQILSKLAEIPQRIFLQFFGYSVNYELLLLASYVLYSHYEYSFTLFVLVSTSYLIASYILFW